jgi:hypothetical protein
MLLHDNEVGRVSLTSEDCRVTDHRYGLGLLNFFYVSQVNKDSVGF